MNTLMRLRSQHLRLETGLEEKEGALRRMKRGVEAERAVGWSTVKYWERWKRSSHYSRITSLCNR